MYDKAVDEHVQAGVQREDAEAMIISGLVQRSQHPRDVVRLVLVNEEDANERTILEEAVRAQVKCATEKVQGHIENIVTLGGFSKVT